MSNYRDIQKSLKKARDLGQIPKNTKLNAKKSVLDTAEATRKANKKAEVNRMVKDIENAQKAAVKISVANKKLIGKGQTKKFKPFTETTIKIGKYLTYKDFLKNIKFPTKLRPVVSYNGSYYTLTPKKVKKLIKQFGTDEFEPFEKVTTYATGTGSDTQAFIAFTGEILDEINLSYIYKEGKKKSGAFFPFTCKMDFDLSRYQVFNKDNKDYSDNCLIHALKMWGQLTDNELSNIKQKCKCDYYPMSKMDELCKEANFTMIVRKYRNDGKKTDNKTFNEGCERVISIGLVEEHYFIDEPINITSFAINNYEEIKEEKDWFLISKKSGKYYKKDKSKLILTSFDVINLLMKNKDTLLEVIECGDEELSSGVYKHIKNVTITPSVSDGNFKEIEYKEKEDKQRKLVFFDYETTTNGNKHIPYLCSAIYEDDTIKSFFGEDCGLEFLNTLNEDTTIIVHNLGYDIKFILPYLMRPKFIKQSSSRIPSASGEFKNFKTNKTIKVEFKCSYALTNIPLRNFAKVFGLVCKKEIMPYDIYTTDSVGLKYFSIEEAKGYLKEDERQQFEDNIKEWKLKKGDKFNHIKYSQLYCEQDVRVTKAGYLKFRGWIKEITGLDVNEYVTIASVADAFLKKDGCYEGCFSVSGVVQQYIQNCIVGGRTMTRENKKWHTQEKLSDFDAVSLYPSAMIRMTGFLKGKAKVLTNKSYDFLKEQDGYFVRINIKKVNKRYAFPLINEKNEDGIRIFDNDLLGIHYIDKTGLEDLINFQKIEFDVVDGYYYNEGHNKKINDTMAMLFNERVKMKKAGNQIQETYKLLMNSSYGKSGQKPIDVETKFIDNKRLATYIVENYHYVNDFVPITGTNYTLVNCVKPINTHFNACHINCEILSMSKRIMNEVMCLAEDENIMIYYQDTDSMHIQADKVDSLAIKYKSIYDRDLIGSKTGQFHTDFDFNSDDEPVAIESYFLGKKCYIDKIETCIDGVKSTDNYHVRMKGIPNEIINITANKNHEGDLMKLYDHLHSGKTEKFDLLAGRCMFGCSSNMEIYTRGNRNDEFVRKLQFV